MTLRPSVYRLIAIICVGIIVVLSILPGEDRPHTGAPGRLEHLIAYGGTSLFFGIGFPAAYQRLTVFFALALLSGVMEGLQLVVPGRSPSLLDAVASSVGAAIGLSLLNVFLRVFHGLGYATARLKYPFWAGSFSDRRNGKLRQKSKERSRFERKLL